MAMSDVETINPVKETQENRAPLLIGHLERLLSVVWASFGLMNNIEETFPTFLEDTILAICHI